MIVKGSQEQVLNVEILGDRVLVRSNIISINTENFKGWEYDEVEYTKDEYIIKMDTENKSLNSQISDLNMNLAEIIGGM